MEKVKVVIADRQKVKVVIVDRQKEIKVPTGIRLLIRRCCTAALVNEGFKGSAEISVSFLNNAQIRQLNAEHRAKDTPTDVLSFPMGVDGVYDINRETGAKVLGDIVISIEKALEQAHSYGHDLRREIGFLTVHSVLHLLGYDHQETLDAMRMREKEENVLVSLGLVRDAGLVPEA